MKTCAQGALLQAGLGMGACLGYALSLPGVTHAIVGCETTAQVDENARLVREFRPFGAEALRALERRTEAMAAEGCYYKK